MAGSDVSARGDKAEARPARDAARRLIEVTDAEPVMSEAPPNAGGSEEELIVERGRTPKRERRGGSIGDFVRENTRLVAAVALLIVGVTLVVLGWYGAAYTNILTEQIPYLISGGLLGAALIIVAGFLASSASLERENRELRRDLVRAFGSGAAGGPNPGSALSLAPSSDGQVFVVPGGRSFHVAGCPLVEGKDPKTLSLRKAIDSGYAACKLCGTD